MEWSNVEVYVGSYRIEGVNAVRLPEPRVISVDMGFSEPHYVECKLNIPADQHRSLKIWITKKKAYMRGHLRRVCKKS